MTLWNLITNVVFTNVRRLVHRAVYLWVISSKICYRAPFVARPGYLSIPTTTRKLDWEMTVWGMPNAQAGIAELVYLVIMIQR
jgi:hypothetical protein